MYVLLRRFTVRCSRLILLVLKVGVYPALSSVNVTATKERCLLQAQGCNAVLANRDKAY